MVDVWYALEGPVINPTIVREKMSKAADLGAAWDNSAFALIDRVIAVDPHVPVAEV
jgi:hypothetical protein